MESFKNEFTKIKAEYDSGESLRKRESLNEKLKGKRIALYGAGELGAEFFRCLTSRGITVEFFCDTYKTGINETTGLSIISPTQLYNEFTGGGGLLSFQRVLMRLR